MINRKQAIHSLAVGASAPLIPSLNAASTSEDTPKRVIFFLQNQGFETATCVPKGSTETHSLADTTLPEPISPLEPYKDRLNIINGLHGKHISPSHSAFFGALGGYRGGIGVPPAGKTIDHVISESLPKGIFPHLCIGMDSIEAMRARPTIATLSATGAGEAISMYSDPNLLYKTLFGGIASEEIKKVYRADSKILNKVQKLATLKGKKLPISQQNKYQNYIKGFQDMNSLRDRLQSVSGHLKKFMPKYDSAYASPEFETDWHDRLLDLGIAALQSGITNVLTVGSGRGQIFGAWKGLGVVENGHNLGHMKQEDNPIWIKIRQYNCRMLVKLMKSLESIPEGNGTMMDNTLIVYSSNNADKQHTDGANWPFMTLGNFSGKIKTGQFLQLDGTRSLNSLYTTFLHTIGVPSDGFNMDEDLAKQYDSKLGPIKELLV